SGTWTIDPAQSTGWLVGTLPIEEAIFFLVTNTLVVFGITLVMSAESHDRVPASVRQRLSAMRRHHDHPLEA
ncbi:MAG: lycopene cyclase domain-containing protein, partial [Caldilineaceae bacterium]|nr:lycopene cyclase domain-containing protein [Caldilineaceae bacterium]